MRSAQTSSKQQRIADDIRQRIVAGEWAPGTRLPKRVALEKIYRAAAQTIQRAVERLLADGFIVSRGRLGTFVDERPPHLHHYGLVMRDDPNDPWVQETMQFDCFLYREALGLREAGECNLSTYLWLEGRTASDDYHRLLSHLRAQRLAGLIFNQPQCIPLVSPGFLPLAELLEASGLPCVVVGPEESVHAQVTSLALPQGLVIDRALDYLRDHDRRAVALLSPGQGGPVTQHFLEGVAGRGMSDAAIWIQGAPGGAARACAHGLMKMVERPDALLITDDSLVEHASAGLLDAGVGVPGEVMVMAHCNYPYVTPSRVPAKRLGFDVREVLRTGLDVIDRRRHGERPPAVIAIAPRFEQEVIAPAAGRTVAVGIADLGMRNAD